MAIERNEEEPRLASGDALLYPIHEHPYRDDPEQFLRHGGVFHGGRRHTHPGFGRARLLPEIVKARQVASGKARRGPRVEAKAGDRVTARGYRQPGKYRGTMHAERNTMIVRLLGEGWSRDDVATVTGLSVAAIEKIERYFDPEGE